MFRTLIVFTFGVFLTQEYGDVIPNVKMETLKFYHQMIKSEFYNKLNENFKNN